MQTLKQRTTFFVVIIFMIYVIFLNCSPSSHSDTENDIKTDINVGGARERKQRSYRYPDAADTGISDSTVFDFESRMGYNSTDPEIVAWDSIERIISSSVQGKDKLSLEMLDAGCGMGRLMNKYCHHFSTCTCIDADPARLKDAKSLVGSSIGLTSDLNANNDNSNNDTSAASASTRTEFYLSSADIYQTDKKFDVILNSHVIQHVTESAALDIITNLRKLLKPDGVLIITTTHFPRTAYADVCMGYTHGNKEGCTKLQSFVSKEQFESIVRLNKPGVLPVHFWTAHALSQLATDAGCIGGGGGGGGVGSSSQYQENRGNRERFTYTYFSAAAVQKEHSLYKGSISAEEFLNNPMSQGIVCRPQPPPRPPPDRYPSPPPRPPPLNLRGATKT